MSKRDLEDNLVRDKSYGKNKQLGIAHDLNTVVASQLVQKRKTVVISFWRRNYPYPPLQKPHMSVHSQYKFSQNISGQQEGQF